MTWKRKIFLSLLIQAILLLGIPEIFRKFGIFEMGYIQGNWYHISHHEILSDPYPKKIVLLGSSDFGERYCENRFLPNAVANDVCTMSSVLNLNKTEFPSMKDFRFYNLTVGGTPPEAHLFFLLETLKKVRDGSIKYVIYDHPKKFFIRPQDWSSPRFLDFMKDFKITIDGLPEDLRSERLTHLSVQVGEAVLKMKSNGIRNGFSENWEYFKKFMTAEFYWFPRFQEKLIELISPGANKRKFNRYLDQELQLYGKENEDFFDEKWKIPAQEYFLLEKEDDFDFLEILFDICQKKKIQLIYYYAPNRMFWSANEPEPWESKVFQPTRKRFEPKGVKFFDYRKLPYIFPRDIQDGDHPSLDTRVKISKMILKELESTEKVRVK